MDISVVVPTCRGFEIPEQSVPVRWYVVHDEVERPVVGERVDIVAPDPEMYGRRASSIRGAGILQAYLDGADVIITVDDDCTLPRNWAKNHADALGPCPLWSNTIRHLPVRGYPDDVGETEVSISHGIWNGVPDISGEDQCEYPGNIYLMHANVWHPIHAPFPMSSMNVGFTRKAVPLMYFWPMGGVFDRYEDIWGGLVAQRLLSGRFVNGGAAVYHERASNAEVNKRKEAPGKEVHERLWPYIWAFDGGWAGMADHLERFDSGRDDWDKYFSQVSRNMRNWATLTAAP